MRTHGQPQWAGRDKTLDICELLVALAAQRPVFHSEADFQHALAWELHRRLPHAAVRLELPVDVGDKTLHLDLWVEDSGAALAIELKYKVAALRVEVGGETFALKSQSAQDTGRYDFVKDIERLERITTAGPGVVGYAIFLTNERTYWSASRDAGTADHAFRLHEGRVLRGPLDWGPRASQGTKRGREQLLTLQGAYTLHWQDYSRLSAARNGELRYLAVRVGDVPSVDIAPS